MNYKFKQDKHRCCSLEEDLIKEGLTLLIKERSKNLWSDDGIRVFKSLNGANLQAISYATKVLEWIDESGHEYLELTRAVTPKLDLDLSGRHVRGNPPPDEDEVKVKPSKSKKK